MIVKLITKVREFCLHMLSVIRFKKKSCFDYQNFHSFHGFRIGVYSFNLLYGNYKAIKKLSKGKFNPLRDFSEHGIVFSDSLQSIPQLNLSKIRDIYTCSDIRKSIITKYVELQKANNKVYAVGPFILGAQDFWTEAQITQLKKQYGKILLCYPAHSIVNVKNEFDLDEFIKSIEKIKNYFQSVFVCLHLLDINGPLERKCIDRGYKVVSNGHPDDPLFLSRQKSVMMLSDMVMSNCIGTHIGYSIAVGTPFYFVPQKITNLSKAGEFVNEYEKVEKKRKDELEIEILTLFGDFSFEINRQQREFIEKIWGKNEFNI